MDTSERYTGALIGLAVGDALGTTLEFKQPGTFAPIADMQGGGASNLQPGFWTDDTTMSLLLCESLLEKRDLDLNDQLERYVKWYREGYLSSTGYCFDMGKTTRIAIERFEKFKTVRAGNISSHSGNGSIMRLAPVPLFYANSPELAVSKSGESSVTTHGSKECVDACRLLGALIVGAVHGLSKDDILSPQYKLLVTQRRQCEFHPELMPIIEGAYKVNNPPEIKGTGYVVKSLEAALWAFYNSESFKEGILMAVNLGDDADTTGAVYGQLAGTYYGFSDIPENWCEKLAQQKLILSYAARLYEAAQTLRV